MMQIDIITVHPELLDGPLNHSIVQRARNKSLVDISIHNLRDFSNSPNKKIDDYQYGGGAGMVMMIEPIAKAIDHFKSKRRYDEIILFTPDGELYNQPMANHLSMAGNLLMLCGHYKGVDERIKEHYITMEISIGDYVLTGGELPAAVVCDSIIRLIPGAIGNESSALNDSFQDNLLSPPLYTRPEVFNGLKVPDILLSGNQKLIDEWRMKESIKKTQKRRPDLLKENNQ